LLRFQITPATAHTLQNSSPIGLSNPAHLIFDMETSTPKGANRMLLMNTLAFTVCFAAWMLNGVLVTFLTVNQVFNWSATDIGWLLGIPVLTGSIFRLPAGMLTDKFGGKPVMTALLILCSIPMFLLAGVNSYWAFALCSFGFGLVGVSFSVGIAYTSVWFPKGRQGLALGIFGAGNAGSAITTLVAPSLLNQFTDNGANLEGWRTLPMVYGVALVIMGIVFYLTTTNKKPQSNAKTFAQQLEPLKNIRVWRFGLYYFLVFGCFVAFSQWLVPYFVNVYYLPLVTAGFLAALFSFPSGLIRALGGWLSDSFGGRKVMYRVLGSSVFLSFLLIVPKMEITSPGKGVAAERDGIVTAVSSDSVTVGDKVYAFKPRGEKSFNPDEGIMAFPRKEAWQEIIVEVGQTVKRKELVAKGVTKIFFQANVWIFAGLVMLLGIAWGVGKAAVYKHIPEYFPEQVGVVGGIVGVLGGLGGFVCPIIFGYLLDATGLWTSAWMFMLFLSAICLMWMHIVIQKMMHGEQPALMKKIEH
jgi:MFS transporter, NNP family, nitrate/nitrite transporter